MAILCIELILTESDLEEYGRESQEHQFEIDDSLLAARLLGIG